MAWIGSHIEDYLNYFIDNTKPIYRGTGADDGLYCYYSKLMLDKWVIANTLTPTLSVDSVGWTLYWYYYNGKPYWSNGSLYLWWDSGNSRWVISSRLGACTAESLPDSSGRTYYDGDSWWSKSGAEVWGEYEARGSNRVIDSAGDSAGAEVEKDVVLTLTGYEHAGSGTAPAGEYSSVTKILGTGGDSSTGGDSGGVGVKLFGNVVADSSGAPTTYEIGSGTTKVWVCEAGLWL